MLATAFAAHGWELGLSDDEILSRLLAHNLERGGTAGPILPEPTQARKLAAI